MSTISWLSIFSGFSAREIRSLMFDRMSVERRSKIPMMTLYVLAGPHCPAPNLRPRCSASSRSAKSNRSASSAICPCNCETCSSSAATRCGSSPIPPTPTPPASPRPQPNPLGEGLAHGSAKQPPQAHEHYDQPHDRHQLVEQEV